MKDGLEGWAKAHGENSFAAVEGIVWILMNFYFGILMGMEFLVTLGHKSADTYFVDVSLHYKKSKVDSIT